MKSNVRLVLVASIVAIVVVAEMGLSAYGQTAKKEAPPKRVAI
jgi:hypothetical protein